MRNFIFIAVFVAVLAFGTTGYSEKSEEIIGKTAEEVSIEEVREQAKEITSMLDNALSEVKKALTEDIPEIEAQIVKQTEESYKKSDEILTGL